jgi:glycosyltransferase involved in cell wall biosynthesis
LVDAHDTTKLAHYIAQVLGDPTLADELRGKGLERARLSTWEAGAQRLLAVINKVGAGR